MASPNIIPTKRSTADGLQLQVYRQCDLACDGLTNRPIANTSRSATNPPGTILRDLFRLDYRFNDKHSVYGSYSHDKNF